MMRLLNTSPHIVVGEPYPFERKYFAYLFRWARLLDRREWPKRWVGRSFGSLTQEERTPLMGPLRGFREICCAHPAASRRCRSTASTWHGGSSRTVPGRSKGIERASATTPRSTWTRGSSTWRSCHRSRSSSCFATPVTPISRSGHSTGSGASLATRAPRCGPRTPSPGRTGWTGSSTGSGIGCAGSTISCAPTRSPPEDGVATRPARGEAAPGTRGGHRRPSRQPVVPGPRGYLG